MQRINFPRFLRRLLSKPPESYLTGALAVPVMGIILLMLSAVLVEHGRAVLSLAVIAGGVYLLLAIASLGFAIARRICSR